MALWHALALPTWAQSLVWCSVTIGLGLTLLPVVKGGATAVLCLTQAKA